MDEAPWLKPLAAAAMLGVLWIFEAALPLFERRESKTRHDLANLALGVGNAVLVSVLFAAATLWVTETSRAAGFGLLHWIEGGPWVELALAVVLFDFWQYLWHRLNHRIPLLWRFHAVHHADREMDATSAVRFHTGEIVLSATARLAVLPLLGLSIQQVLAYEALLLPIIMFHHSNVRVPGALDRGLRWLIVTPWMHWVHHSDLRPETDSNYSSIFSIWDRIFGSFRLREDPSTITLGLRSATDASEWATLWGMLAMPFRTSGVDEAPDGGPDEGDAKDPA